jgi:hypothetical protein
MVLALVLASSTARAANSAGTFADPVVVDAFPYVVRGTTVGASDVVDVYSCAAQREAGPERVYRFTLAAPARVTAWVESTVDVDVHLLVDGTIEHRTASRCAARGDVIAEADLEPGEHLVVVDTFGAAPATGGAYVLHLDAIGDAWNERTIADGVVWRARRFPDQVVHALVVDPARPGISVKALAASGCQTVATLARAAGAIAGVNGGYFDTSTGSCGPVSLLKASGVLVGRNASASARGAFGLTQNGRPMTALVAQNSDWPEAYEAHGGAPLLATGGVARAGSAAWAEEGLSSAGFLGPNPRTVAAHDSAGRVVLFTVDGRRANARGMSLDALAAFSVSQEIGATAAVNLDGGGSTTLYVAGATPSGVVNYPSDGGSTESPTHAGSRAVSGGFFVFAPPYNHPPRFTTTPLVDAQAGVPYVYDADALDLDVDDTLTYRFDAAPNGASVDADGVVRFTPAVDGPARVRVALTVSDGRGASTTQTFDVNVVGATGANVGAPSAPDGGVTSDGAPPTGCSFAGSASGRTPAVSLLVVALLAVLRARRRVQRSSARPSTNWCQTTTGSRQSRYVSTHRRRRLARARSMRSRASASVDSAASTGIARAACARSHRIARAPASRTRLSIHDTAATRVPRVTGSTRWSVEAS